MHDIGWSLRARLLWLFLIASALGWVGSAVLVLSAAERESAQQGDTALHRSGELLMKMVRHEFDENGGSLEELQSDVLVDFHDFMMQVVAPDGRLLMRSQDAPDTRLGGHEAGFFDVDLPDGRWRVSVLHESKTGLDILIAESVQHRHSGSRRLAIALIAPVLIGLPMLALVAQLFSGRALRPLQQSAEQLAQRAATDLTPVMSTGLPREAEPLVRAFNGLLQRISRLVDDQRQFASTVAHELRTPLAALKLDLQMLADGARSDDDKTLSRALTTLERAIRVIEELLVLARLESSKSAPAASSFDLSRLVDEILRQFALRIAERGLQVETAVPPLALHGFEHPVFIALRNLIENAVRHARPQGRVRVSAIAGEAGGLRLMVEDDGPGLVDDVKNRGTLQLGLGIVDRIVVAMGGRLEHGRSERLGGASMLIQLPDVDQVS